MQAKFFKNSIKVVLIKITAVLLTLFYGLPFVFNFLPSSPLVDVIYRYIAHFTGLIQLDLGAVPLAILFLLLGSCYAWIGWSSKKINNIIFGSTMIYLASFIIFVGLAMWSFFFPCQGVQCLNGFSLVVLQLLWKVQWIVFTILIIGVVYPSILPTKKTSHAKLKRSQK